MTNNLFLALVFLACSQASFAQGHCSLNIKVVNPKDLEVEASITVTEKDGRVHRKENKEGGAEFCDLGVRSVTVVVGKGPCHQVTVRDVQLSWGRTTNLRVTYDPEPCMRDRPPSPDPPSCDVMLRIIDKERRAIPGARAMIKVPFQLQITADQYGRVLLRAKYGPGLEGTVSQERYLPTELKFPCSRDHSLEEHYVVLETAPK
jgi:hypothetical protein